MARVADTLRLREHREQFQRAVRENITMEEARRRIAADRWALVDARLDAKRAAPCESDDRQPGFWWQR